MLLIVTCIAARHKHVHGQQCISMLTLINIPKPGCSGGGGNKPPGDSLGVEEEDEEPSEEQVVTR